MQLSTELETWFTKYEAYHRHPLNKATHWVGVPLILVATLGLLSLVPIGALILILLVLAWTFKLDWKFALIFTVFVLAAAFIGHSLSWQWNLTLFVVGWIFQLIGHYKFEKRSPALADNFLQTFIGPMWIVARLVGLRR